MFTDTKNLGNTNLVDMTFSNTPKSRGKFRKVFKPLLRLISKGSAKSANSSNSPTHPNNVYLNNATSLKNICELSTVMLEDYAAVIQKATKDEHMLQHQQQQQQLDVFASACDSSAVISAASIEKTPISTCNGCSHGRNCQHEQFHYDYVKSNITKCIIAEPTLEDEPDVPVHFIRTENGTFFWTTVQDKIDDDLFNSWLCDNFRQYSTEAVVY